MLQTKGIINCTAKSMICSNVLTCKYIYIAHYMLVIYVNQHMSTCMFACMYMHIIFMSHVVM